MVRRQFAVDADDVAQVETLGQGEIRVAHLILADHHLDRAGPVADLEPMDLARRPPQHDSPGRAHLGAALFGGVRSDVLPAPVPQRFRTLWRGFRRSGNDRRTRPPKGQCPFLVFCAAYRVVRPPGWLHCLLAAAERGRSCVDRLETGENGEENATWGHFSESGGWVNVKPNRRDTLPAISAVTRPIFGRLCYPHSL